MYHYQDPELSFHHTAALPPNLQMQKKEAPHSHKMHEIFYFISGKASYLVEGRIYRLVPGSIMIMRSGEFHKIVLDEDEPYERMVINFKASVLAGVDPAGLLLRPFIERPLGVGNHFPAGKIQIGHIYEALKSMDHAIDLPEQRHLAILSNLFSILYEIQNAYLRRGALDPSGNGIQTLGSSIVDYINANLFGELSLDILSEKFFISKNHLNRLFKEATGSTVWEYIQVKRLNAARSSIRQGSSAVAACAKSGFNDYSAFYRAYKKHFGESPSQT